MNQNKHPQMLKAGLAQLLERTPSTETEKDAYIRELQYYLKDVLWEVENLKEKLA